jgi:hypothetical protein
MKREFIDQRSLAIHHYVAGKIRANPKLFSEINMILVTIRRGFQLPTNPSAYGGVLLPGANRV